MKTIAVSTAPLVVTQNIAKTKTPTSTEIDDVEHWETKGSLPRQQGQLVCPSSSSIPHAAVMGRKPTIQTKNHWQSQGRPKSCDPVSLNSNNIDDLSLAGDVNKSAYKHQKTIQNVIL